MKMIIKTYTIIATFVLFVCGQDFASGDGTENNPWIITTKEHLKNVGKYLSENHQDKYFKLGGNIVLNGNVSNQWTPIGRSSSVFLGNFDGAGYYINGVYIDKNSDEQGLFGISGGTIKNLGVVESFIKGRDFVGGLVGYNGGIISNCYSTGNVEGRENVGGLVGESDEIITNSYSTGNVNGEESVGGLVGENEGIVTNSYSMANVQGIEMVGGLAGYNDALIENCYSIGNVHGNINVGGLIGMFNSDYDGIIKNSYYAIETSGQNDNDGRGEPKTTAEMRQQSTFLNWDFEKIWSIDAAKNNGFPYLDLRDYTPIYNIQKTDNLYGIRLTKNIVSESVEISVIIPNNEKVVETKFVVYDNVVNIVFSSTEKGDKIIWNLTNNAGRLVANGSYLVIAEVKSVNEKSYHYSVKLGVKR